MIKCLLVVDRRDKWRSEIPGVEDPRIEGHDLVYDLESEALGRRTVRLPLRELVSWVTVPAHTDLLDG